MSELDRIFPGKSSMAQRMREFDWSRSDLGSPASWPQNLRIALGICLLSRFPMHVWWGSNLTLFYNDAYVSFLGPGKHPAVLGRSGRLGWAEIWPAIGPMIEAVFETGSPTWSEDILMYFDRDLPKEEVYVTFSFSPILGDNGGVEGMFCACTETTEKIIGNRRLDTLRKLGVEAAVGRTVEEACNSTRQILGENLHDIPFSALYVVDDIEKEVHLVASTGFPKGEWQPPNYASLKDEKHLRRSPWPLAAVFRSQRPADSVAMGKAILLPIRAPTQEHPVAIFVAGVSPQRPLNESYRTFFDLVAGHIGTAIGDARAYEEKRQRAEALAELDRTSFSVFIPTGTAHLPKEHISKERAAGAPNTASFVEEARRWNPGDTRTVPVLAGAEPAGAEPRKARAESGGGTLTPEARVLPRILLVDDNADIREDVSRLLASNYEVETEANGDVAWERIQADPPALVLTDVRVPGRDGFSLLREIRGHPSTKMLPVILLSAPAGEESRVEGLQQGADDYLIKPFTARELLARIGTHLELSSLRREAGEQRRRAYEEARLLVAQRTAELAHVNEKLRERDERIRLTNADLKRRLRELQAINEGARDSRRAALNVLEDAVESRRKLEVEIVERKQAEEALSRSQQKLEGTLKEAERARQEAEAANRTKDHFLAMLSHELRTPLTPVLMAAESLLERKDLPARVTEALEMICRNILIETHFVDDLLDVTRISNGKLQLAREPVNIHEAVRRSMEVTEPDIRARKQELAVDLGAERSGIEGDFSRLQQAFWNLLKNASKFTPARGQIRVTSRNEGTEWIVIEVSDTGRGIDPLALHDIFEPFRQGDEATVRQFGGLGLGLAIAKATIAGHQGTLGAFSEGQGKGSTFTVRLPVRRTP